MHNKFGVLSQRRLFLITHLLSVSVYENKQIQMIWDKQAGNSDWITFLETLDQTSV